MKKKIITILTAIIIALGGGYSAVQLGSVVTGSDYESIHITSANASSTAANFAKRGYGSLGSVVITKPATAGFINIYNATTTTAYATSTAELLTAFDSSNDVAGTYTFDLEFSEGLQIDVPAGFNGEYTITYR